MPATLMRPPGESAPASEDELLRALRAGDEDAFAWVVRRYHPSLVRVVRAHVASDSVAEEVVQETWLAVLEGISRFRADAAVKTWIFHIAVNRAITRGVRERRVTPFSTLPPDDDQGTEAERFTADGQWATPPRPFQLPEERLALLELRERLRVALEQLPERQRAVVALRDVEGFSAQEICALLAISVENQRVLLHRGRARLRDVLVDEER